MPAEATDNIKDFPAVLSLTLISPGEREPSGSRFRGQHIAGQGQRARSRFCAGWRLRLTRPTEASRQLISPRPGKRTAAGQKQVPVSNKRRRKKPEVSLRLFSITSRYALRHVFVLRHRVAEAFSSRRPDRPDRYRPRSGPESSSSLPG